MNDSRMKLNQSEWSELQTKFNELINQIGLLEQ
jgi:hypothetical protein